MCACVCWNRLLPSPTALPMFGQELALAISSSPAYLPACLEVLVQKIETTLCECILFFYSPPPSKYAPCVHKHYHEAEDNAARSRK